MQYKFLAVKKKDNSCRKDRRSSFFFKTGAFFYCVIFITNFSPSLWLMVVLYPNIT